MERKTIKLISALCIFTLLCGCGGNKEKAEVNIWGADPKNAECIYEDDTELDPENFKVIEDEDEDGSRCVVIKHHTFASSGHYRLLSPNGNLRIFASGSQEMVGQSNLQACGSKKVLSPPSCRAQY